MTKKEKRKDREGDTNVLSGFARLATYDGRASEGEIGERLLYALRPGVGVDLEAMMFDRGGGAHFVYLHGRGRSTAAEFDRVAVVELYGVGALTVEIGPVGTLIIAKVKTVGTGLDKRVLFRRDPLGIRVETNGTCLAASDGEKAAREFVSAAGERAAIYADDNFHSAMIETKGPMSNDSSLVRI